MQINNDDSKYAAGSIEDYIQRIATVNPAPNVWHHYEVEVKRKHIVATLDGVMTLDGRDPSFKSGPNGVTARSVSCRFKHSPDTRARISLGTVLFNEFSSMHLLSQAVTVYFKLHLRISGLMEYNPAPPGCRRSLPDDAVIRAG